jgi:hypothetical protein
MLRVKKPEDLGAGILFVLFGLAGLWFGKDYTVGTAARMGPGYFPMLLSWLLIGFGGFIAARAFVIEGPKIEPFRWRSILLVFAAIASYALTIQRFGLAVAAFLVVAIAAPAARQTRWPAIVLLGVFMAAFCVGVFIFGLNQPLPLWREG